MFKVNKYRLIITFDVEDWFTNGQSIKVDSWGTYELRVEKNIDRILILLDQTKTFATFFILGWVAEKLPGMVEKIHKLGHEISSHGYAHELVYLQSKNEFRNDVRKSKLILEDIIGERIYGYRAPCFSITDWALPILAEEGYIYDSSYAANVLKKSHLYHFNTFINCNKIYDILYEVFLPYMKINNLSIPWGGGGYFRLYPYSLYEWGVKKLLATTNMPFVFYLHPYEVDHEQPVPFSLNVIKLMQQYYGRKLAYNKLEKLIKVGEFTTVKEFLSIEGEFIL